MANSSDQIQADIARTRARMSSQLNQATRPYGASAPAMGGRAYAGTQGTPTDLSVEGIVGQMRQRPLLTLGLGLIAGSLLQDYLGGESSSASTALATRPTYPTYGAQSTVGTTYGQPSTSARQSVNNAARSVGNAAQSAGDVVADTASGVVDTARDAASAVVDTTVDVANRVADTTVDVAYQAMDMAGNVAEEATERVSDLTTTITDFVSGSPLMALGLSLAAGSLLQRYLRGGSSTTRVATTSYPSSYPAYPPTYGSYTTSGTYARPGAQVGHATREAADAIGDAAQATGRAATNAASRAVDTTVDAASAVAGTAAHAVGTVADATVDVAQRAGNVAMDTADYVVDTASDAAGYVADTVSDLWPTITRQVQERPLATLGVAIVAGSLLQPTLAPHVKAVTSDVRELWSTVSGTMGDALNLPEPPEVQRIKDAIVPATVERTQQLLSRDGREYLEGSLEGMIGSPSLRAGVVAAFTDKAEEFVGNRLPNFLNGLGGTSGLLLLGLAGAVLEARNQAQQGQGQTITNVRTALSQSIVENAQQQLSRFFPEFRDQMQSQQSASVDQQCPNCGTHIAANSRFCPNCGRATTGSGGTSV